MRYDKSPQKWQLLEDIKLYNNDEYWIAFGNEVRQVTFNGKYFEYPSLSPNFCSHPHIVYLSEVQYIIPIFHPERPDNGQWTGTTNINKKFRLRVKK